MNKDKKELYNEVLIKILERYELTEERLFNCNCSECVEARISLVITLHSRGLSDGDIAELTQKMRRCSVCLIRNKYSEANASWSVKSCIEKIKKELAQ